MATGRFAPSPTGALHLGNLRTALLAWLFARSTGSRFIVRIEDLDRVTSSRAHERQQLGDLGSLGLDWDGAVVRQSERFELYDVALARLADAGLTYPCYCSRREVQAAASAPHGDLPEGSYPGTCRHLTSAQLAERERDGRRPALRLLAAETEVTVVDRLHGPITGRPHDVVLRRNDGVPAYNLAVVVDDADQGVEEVVRGDDLLAVTPSQVHLTERLGLPVPTYAHVPLVLGPDGTRLAKRHGAVTLAELAAHGRPPNRVLALLATSLGLTPPGTTAVAAAELVARFDPDDLPREPWTLGADLLGADLLG